MKQLTGLDANFLYMETPNSFGHVQSLIVYDRPDDPSFDPFQAFREQVRSRLHLLDPFRRRLVEVPFDLDHPYWINDPDFDLDFHVRHIAIPPPGDLRQLSAQVARIIGRPIDRSRPLWEAYVFEGLEDGRFAIMTKVHHATIDGASGVRMLGLLLDHSPDGDDVPPDPGLWRADPVPSDAELVGKAMRSFARTPGKLVRAQLRTMRHVADTTRSRGAAAMIENARRQFPTVAGRDRDEGRVLTRTTASAPPTPFNKSITPHRRLAIGSVPLDDIKTLKSALGATVNDVVMAICSGALRDYLLSHDALPWQPLKAMVPVSIRTGDEDDIWTNRVSGLVAELPTDEADPATRVARVHDAMVEAKDQFDMMPAEAMVDMAQFAPPALSVQAARVAASLRVADRANPPVNVVISNVPGPRSPLYMAGAEMKHFFPVSTIADGIGLNITVQSYHDTLDIGLVACRELIPDLDDLLDLHIAEVDVLFAAAGITRNPPATAKSSGAAKSPTKKSSTEKSSSKKSSTKKTTTEKTTSKRTSSKKRKHRDDEKGSSTKKSTKKSTRKARSKKPGSKKAGSKKADSKKAGSKRDAATTSGSPAS